ncbi:MAG: NAD(P)-dependent oxidoreductase, partial [Tepidisphaeraceae bacterium]
GKAVARRANAFGMRVLGNDIKPLAPSVAAPAGIELTSLDQLLAQSDFVTLHTDLNPTSYHLFGPAQLSAMKRTAVLINTSRGPVVDEPALVAALESGTIAGAALDVFEVEPLPKNSPLLKRANVLLAAHNSNSSPAAWERVHLNSIQNLMTGLREVKRDARRAA